MRLTTRLDRYLILQIAAPFLFFVLVFTGVIWLALSLRVIDTVVASGQAGNVFLEFVVLLIPRVLSVVLPIAAFVGAIYAVNRLYSESELTVILASGVSGRRLLWPIAVFGMAVALVTALMTVALAPTANREMQERVSQVRGDIAAAFLRPGTFVTPEPGVTVYLRDMPRPGEMLGIFVHDERDPTEIVTYTAERAVLIDNADGPRLVMFDGIAQSSNAQASSAENGDALSLLRFEQLGYDLASFTKDATDRIRKPSELYLDRLLTITEEEARPRNLGDYRAEGHEALSAPLYVIALPMLATALLISGGYRRQGIALRIFTAVGAGLVLRLIGLALKSATSNAAFLWPTMYLPPLLGIALAVWIVSSRFALPRGKRVAAPRPAGPREAGLDR